MFTLRVVPFWLAWSFIASPAPGQSPVDTSRLTIEINLPAFRLDARFDSVIVASFPVAIGMRQYPTPVGAFSVTELQWNPWWRPPDSWWARNDTVTPPGPRNPMGKVKMALGSKLYMHGTPQPKSIGKAASHACIRMRNDDAVALARLVQEHGGANVPAERMSVIMSRWATTYPVSLPRLVAVNIVYHLVELRGDEMQFHPDVYRRGRAGVMSDGLALLASAGYDTAAVDRDVLGRMAKRGERAPYTAKIAELFPEKTANAPTPHLRPIRIAR